MDIVPFLQQMFRETSKMRLVKHCKGMNVQIEAIEGKAGDEASLSERVSTITLLEDGGCVVLNIYFNLDAAVAWAARGLRAPEDEVDDSVAIDFFREFSNLHAGCLRGLFDAAGLPFAMSLPFVMAGEANAPSKKMLSSRSTRDTWILTDGEFQVVLTSEIDLSELNAIVPFQKKLEDAFANETKKFNDGENDGAVEFFI